MWEGWEEEQQARRRRYYEQQSKPDPGYSDPGYDDSDRGGGRQTDWAGATIVFLLLLLAAIVLLVLVVTADFGDSSKTTVPRTPGPCAPFCTGQP
ncbi:hypothetical protein [Nocardia sp. XZ_19_385]|uniref:hypothetical protein n=1 Tax=Nocardia sp. XZ_19_385 TaxID=2769488 RepID=UPI00188E675B|nr:hypothetical protein [Nocardia sp. XZ_19_385]